MPGDRASEFILNLHLQKRAKQSAKQRQFALIYVCCLVSIPKLIPKSWFMTNLLAIFVPLVSALCRTHSAVLKQ